MNVFKMQLSLLLVRREKKISDWFNENDDEIRALLKDRTRNKKELQRRIRQIKNDWFLNKAIQAENFYHQNNLSTVADSAIMSGHRVSDMQMCGHKTRPGVIKLGRAF